MRCWGATGVGSQVCTPRDIQSTTSHWMPLKSKTRLRCRRNGQYKLTHTPAILRALADRIIPGLPPSLRVAILQQTSTDAENPTPAKDGPSTPAPEDTTVLQHVIEGDRSRTALIQDLQGLSPLHLWKTTVVNIYPRRSLGRNRGRP